MASTPARDRGGKLDRLPKWAQTEMRRLESDNRQLKKKNREMMGNTDSPTEVYIWEGMDMIPLPHRTQIRFQTFAGNKNAYFDVSIRDGRLRIYGSRWYAIHPSASNTVDIKISED